MHFAPSPPTPNATPHHLPPRPVAIPPQSSPRPPVPPVDATKFLGELHTQKSKQAHRCQPPAIFYNLIHSLRAPLLVSHSLFVCRNFSLVAPAFRTPFNTHTSLPFPVSSSSFSPYPLSVCHFYNRLCPPNQYSSLPCRLYTRALEFCLPFAYTRPPSPPRSTNPPATLSSAVLRIDILVPRYILSSYLNMRVI